MKTAPLPLWKIYIPCMNKDGREFPVSMHKVWDAEVCKMTGGMTLLRQEEGKWVDQSGTMTAEPMIPILLACTQKQLFEVIGYTLSYYQQQEIMASKISDEVWIVSEKDFDNEAK